MVLNQSELSLQYIRDNLCQPRSCDHRVFFAELFAQVWSWRVVVWTHSKALKCIDMQWRMTERKKESAFPLTSSCMTTLPFHTQIMNNTMKRKLSFSYDIPDSGGFNTRKRRWEDNSVTLKSYTSVKVKHWDDLLDADKKRGFTYVCVHFPSDLRSLTHLGRWPWRWQSIQCQDPSSPERGRFRHYSG